MNALKANQQSVEPFRFPLTIQQWVAEVLEPLSHFDLLRGRVHTFATVDSIELAELEPEALLPMTPTCATMRSLMAMYRQIID